MSDDDLLQALADAAGIEGRYWDIRGRLYERSIDTARTLLRALHVPCGSAAEIRESLSGFETARWRDAVPSVAIGYAGADVAIDLRAEWLGKGSRLHWEIALESGEKIAGEAGLDDLPVVAAKEIAGRRISLRRLTLPSQPVGYHKLRIGGESEVASDLIVAPGRCFLPKPAGRYWGVSAQIYSLRSTNDQGIGDFVDLQSLLAWAARQGADFIGINPLHALFWDAPQDASPYCPSSRQFLNALYLNLGAIAGAGEIPEIDDHSSPSRDRQDGSRFVDYPAVAARKFMALHGLYRDFSNRPRDALTAAFDTFVREGAQDLENFGTFQALSGHFKAHHWQRWPAAFRDPASPEVDRFKRERRDEIRFYKYLQWQSDLQLNAVAREAGAASMALGVYADLAVGVDAAGADHWSDQASYLADIRVGCPPDPFNELGQEWGVVAFDPRQLSATGYRRFRALLRANMRRAGALRVDHVMGWERLFVIPAGGKPADGAYLRYPFRDMLAVAALESERNRCVLIGEDLGTVRAGFREEMAAARVLSYRVLYFEKDDGGFRKPSALPNLAVASATTHDLATLRGYWTSSDIKVKARLGIIQPDEEQENRKERERDKQQLVAALRSEGLWAGSADADHVAWSPSLAGAIHAYLARSSCMMVVAQLDDLVEAEEQVNLPGTSTEYPNWRRRLGRTVNEIADDTSIRDALAAVDRIRKG